MINITSPDNKIVKDAAALAEKKRRDLAGCYVVEGPNLIREALKQGVKLRSVFFEQTGGESASREEELAQLISLAAGSNLPMELYALSREAFSKIAQTDTPQGVLAVAEKKNDTEEDFFKAKAGNVLVLDRIQDPGNLGTLLRTAEAAGLSGAMLLKGCGDVYSPKAVRAAAGTLFRLPLLFVATPREAMDILHKNNKRIYATAARDSTFYFRCALAENAAIVVGNEGNGVAEEFLTGADQIISIPMEGSTESLNAALAGGIIMYEALRQRMSDLR